MRLTHELQAAGIDGDLLERADLVEREYESLQKANTLIDDAECEVIKNGSWYEWMISGIKCDYGYHTWREAYQAGRAELHRAERDILKGKITGAVLHLKALGTALRMSKNLTGVVDTLQRVIKFLEE